MENLEARKDAVITINKPAFPSGRTGVSTRSHSPHLPRLEPCIPATSRSPPPHHMSEVPEGGLGEGHCKRRVQASSAPEPRFFGPPKSFRFQGDDAEEITPMLEDFCWTHSVSFPTSPSVCRLRARGSLAILKVEFNPPQPPVVKPRR